MSFEECTELVACPYCRRPKGSPCFINGKGYLPYPHKSRALLAFKEREARAGREESSQP